jgi:hypothetical protein
VFRHRASIRQKIFVGTLVNLIDVLQVVVVEGFAAAPRSIGEELPRRCRPFCRLGGNRLSAAWL